METEKFYRYREEFHRYPELSGQEIRTAARIKEILTTYSPTNIHTGIGGNGVVAEFCFPGNGPVLLFRADTDAVVIEEHTNLSYRSENPGISHKCGHDGHTTILLAFAELLHRQPLNRGRVLLLFQPSEENGEGARNVLKNPWFRQQKIDQAYALHNLPGYPMSSVICRSGSFTCSVISCCIRIDGKTAHAAEPEKAVSPVSVLLNILQESQKWNRGNLCTPDYFRSTLVELHIGEEAYGVTAGNGLIRLTLRAATETKLKEYIHRLEELVRSMMSGQSELHSSIEWLEAFTANENHPSAVDIIETAARNKRLTYQTSPHPFAWGEDFGLFTQYFPGAMFGLGAGIDTPSLHTPGYDFPNEIIQSGAQMFYEIARLITV